MARCPACQADVPTGAAECPGCRLSASLFDDVRAAAGPEASHDPVFLQTIGELLRSVDLTVPAAPPDGDGTPKLLDRGGTRRRFDAPADRPVRPPTALAPLDQLPGIPAMPRGEALRRRFEEYRALGARTGVSLGPLVARAGPAELVADDASLEAIVREMFVHLAGTLAEQYESTLARRNELALLVPTPGVDVEFAAVRGAIGAGDLGGGFRRLDHIREELGRIEEEWATGRILATECDLLAETLRELGGDPAPALGPLEAGRRNLGTGQREPAERLLAQAAIALWTMLKPKFMEELKRLRDRLVEARTTGAEIGPAVAELRSITVELRARNFVGTITAYRHLRAFVTQSEPPPGTAPSAAAPEAVRPAPSA